MTQLSVTPPAAVGAAPAPSESAPGPLAQAAQRAEFSARLLAALAALRGVPADPTAPPAAEAPAFAVDVGVALPEEAGAEQAPEDAAPPEGALADTATGVPADFAPLVLPQIARADTVQRTSEDESESAAADVESEVELSAEPESESTTPAPPRPATLASAASLPLATNTEGQPEAAAEAEARGAASALEPAAASAEPPRRAAEESNAAPARLPEPATEPALARGPELTAPPAQSARGESATPAAGRVLPELPVRNEQEIVDQVRFLLNRRGGQASIELHPPQLGQLGLRIHVTDHAVRLEITADRLQVAELLHRHLPELQHALESQGLQIDRAQVDLRERSSDGRERGGDFGDAEPRRGRDSDGEGSPRQPGHSRPTLPAYSLGAVDVHA